MKGLLILAKGFEDVEALATLDVLRRSKLDISTVSVSNELEVLSQSGVFVKADLVIKDINYQEYDFLVIPGGKAVFSVLDKLNIIDEMINFFIKENRLVAAICAAPHLIGKLGHLKEKDYTCFPSCETEIIGGKYLIDEGVIRNGNIITSKAMAYTFDFALEIIEYIQGKKQRQLILNNIKGE